MADEQDWAAYADQATMAADDTLLARTAAGAGVEIPGSAVVRKDGSGNAGIGTESPAARLHVNQPSAGEVARFSGISANSFKMTMDGGGDAVFSISDFTAIFANEYGPGDIALRTNSLNRLLVKSDGTVRPGADNTQTFGSASFRWSTLYAGTGTVNTSDEREKTWRSGLSDAEYAAACQIIDELGFFQWNDSIAEKGSDARLHFGARAQRVFAILDEHLGADEWHRYAFACYDSWEDELRPVFEAQIIPAVLDAEGRETEPERTEMVDTGETRKTLEAGDRYGLREGQFTMFLLAAQARRQGELEQRIALLEA